MQKEYTESIVGTSYLYGNPTHIFVFGDNTIHKGYGGAAIHRDMDNSYGFITKKLPNNNPTSFYKPLEYKPIFDGELSRLMDYIEANPDLTFLISRLGSGLANKYEIWEYVICEGLKVLEKYPNVKFLYKRREQ